MTFSEIQKKYNDVLEHIINDRLLDALQNAAELASQVSSSDLQNRYQSDMDTYSSMLKYSFELAPDPERVKIHNKLKQSVLELVDDIRDAWIYKANLFDRVSQTQKAWRFESEYLTDMSQTVMKLSEVAEEPDVPENSSDGTEVQNNSHLVDILFHWLWLKSKYNSEVKSIFLKVISAVEINWSTKALMVSALTLSQLRHFDREKVYLLFDLSVHENSEIRQRAIIGLFISLLVFQKRTLLYPDIIDRIKSIPDNEKFQERMFAILLQYIRASETEKITRKIQEEIVPEVMKIKSELEDKLNLEDLLSKEKLDEKNPEWANFFKDAPDVYQKLEQFSKMQIEGADVFMGAFAMLKHFSFFQSPSNWFIPFTAENIALKGIFQGDEKDTDNSIFFEGLEKSTILCNSDKYSFCLNIKQMPELQRTKMLELFNMEIKAMNEAMEDEFKLEAESKNKITNTQYFQDLYRFFKLHPFRKEYESIFEFEVNLLKSDIFKEIFYFPKLIGNLAEFYFAKDRYSEALGLFNWLNNQGNSFELLEKKGYCYQKLGNYSKAIELYKQAELFDKNKIWLQKKLGYCYRKTGEFAKAIEYYKQIIKAEPNDLNNLAYLGHLHIDIEDFENALKYYYKVEYEKPDNLRVYRPIAWCSFVQEKYEIAIKYFSKLLESMPNKSDYLNIGHCYWASGQLGKALESYREGVRLSGRDQNWFRETFSHDSKYLHKKGISDLDVALMIDYVLLA
jgi:tetratricopeptide (TPR) repeat protein